jgi:hypothetical protein
MLRSGRPTIRKKSDFADIKYCAAVVPALRGLSKNPLYVSASGNDTNLAANHGRRASYPRPIEDNGPVVAKYRKELKPKFPTERESPGQAATPVLETAVRTAPK